MFAAPFTLGRKTENYNKKSPVNRLSVFPFPLLAIFSPFPQTERLFTG